MKGVMYGVYAVLDYLMGGRDFVYSEKDIYENTGASKSDTALALKVLPRLGLVSNIKDTYKFRKQTPAGKIFLKFHNAVLNEICETYGLMKPKEVMRKLAKADSGRVAKQRKRMRK